MKARAAKGKVWASGVLLVALFAAGSIVVSRHLIQQEQRRAREHLMQRGRELVHLLAHTPFEEMGSEQRRYFLRSFFEQTGDDAFVYLAVQDERGEIIAQLDPHGVLKSIPPDVADRPVIEAAGIPSAFRVESFPGMLHEFIKPLFRGNLGGRVRLGLTIKPDPALSSEHVSYMAMVPFFMLASLVVGYHGLSVAMAGRLRSVPAPDWPPSLGHARPRGGDGLLAVASEWNHRIVELEDRVQGLSNMNTRLMAEAGAMKFERGQMARILDALDIGILITGMDDQVVHANQFMLNLLQADRDQVVDRQIFDVIREPALHRFLAGSATESPGPRAVEIELPDLSAQDIWHVACAGLTDLLGAQAGKRITFQNATQRKRLQLSQQNFVAHLAHEVRTPLTSIKAYSEMLMNDEITSPTAQKEFYNTINAETDRLAELIENLLNLSQMEAGMLDTKRGLVRTDWLLENCLPAIEASAIKKNITLTKRLPDHYPYLHADKTLLKVVLVNILGNAVKYTPPGGTITLALFVEENRVCIDVADTGIGIPDEELPLIFEKFHRSSQEDAQLVAGTGLGLSIASHIVDLHGGRIDVESELGKGARFTIKLPKEEYQLETAKSNSDH